MLFLGREFFGVFSRKCSYHVASSSPARGGRDSSVDSPTAIRSSPGLSQSPGCFCKDFIYLFLEIEEGRDEERERNMDQPPPTRHPLGTWPDTRPMS